MHLGSNQEKKNPVTVAEYSVKSRFWALMGGTAMCLYCTTYICTLINVKEHHWIYLIFLFANIDRGNILFPQEQHLEEESAALIW